MKRVAIAELKSKLSEFLERVKTGTEYLVTDRGKPIARLSPLKAHAIWTDLYEQLVKKGQVRPPKREFSLSLFEKTSRPKDPKGRILQALLQEREDGR